MIGAGDLLNALAARGVRMVTGVPCSFLSPVINRAASDPVVRYCAATHEGEAVAMAVGVWLAGFTPLVIAQNSGLGNMVNPLTSLVHPCRVPLPLLVTWRGQPGFRDEPQHELMGAVMFRMLDLLDATTIVLGEDPARLAPQLDQVWKAMARRELPACLVLRKGVVRDEPLREPPLRSGEPGKVHLAHGPRRLPWRHEALTRLLEVLPDAAAVVASTGHTGRELFTLADRPQHFYLVGAMGSASALGLGTAMYTERPVVVVDGDGALLMRLGTLAAIGAHVPRNLVHVLLDNRLHDSTGGQRTLSAVVDLPSVAAACGYRNVWSCTGLEDFGDAIEAALATAGPAFIYLRIRPGALPGLGRPDVHPRDVARRFRDFVTGPSDRPASAAGARRGGTP